MSAWSAYTDPLCLSLDQAFSSGENWIDNRSLWHGVSEITLAGAWFKDAGPRGMDQALLEPRAFCTAGTARIDFTGATLVVRLNVAFSWFTGATVLIDGVAPSTLGLLTACDTLSCDAATYLLTSDAYLDVCVADGLVFGAHSCLITIASPSAAKFFSIAGYKVCTLATQVMQRTGGWLVPLAETLLGQNQIDFTLTNRGSASVLNVALTFPPSLVDTTGAPLALLTAATLDPGASITQNVLPVFTGLEFSGEFPMILGLQAEYVDPAGPNTHTVTVTAAVGNTAALTVSGTWFGPDNATPTGQARLYTTAYGPGNAISFTFVGDALTITVQQASSWGVLGVYAADNTTLLNSVNCNVASDQLGVHTLTGFGAGSHTVHLRKTVNDSAFVVFISAAWSVTQQYSLAAETLLLDYVANQPVALRVVDPVLGPESMRFTAPILGAVDFSGTTVRKNTDLRYTELLARLPTFAVCYQPGFADILGQYDILIVDPFAVHAADAEAWQANGIKVFGYISSGEEFGFYTNRYDFASALAPNGGTGPGGYATYYMRTRDGVNPDQDGVWAAYYVNPDPAFGWPQRLQDYYAPLVLSAPVHVVGEVVTLKQATITAGSVLVFDTAQAPLDIDRPMLLSTLDGNHTYAIYQDFTFDAKTGAVVMNTAVSPAVTAGQQLKFSYTRKGLELDGVFLDTVDTPDVYGSTAFGYVLVPGYAAQFAAMINTFKVAYPDAQLISNRGFTILDDIIASCAGVMFESWLTLPDDISQLATTTYHQITDAPTIAANEAINVQLRRLRASHRFDVYSLNYVSSGDAGAALRNYCRMMDAQRGYLSWQSTITLDNPAPNTIAKSTPAVPDPVTSNAFATVFTRLL